MISKKDKVNNEYYVDRIPDYLVQQKKRVTFFDVDYLSWGTPQDYELYQNSIAYWGTFAQKISSEERNAPTLSIIIPCYNEAGNVPLILDRFEACVGNKKNVEVICVNNGSTDKTGEYLAAEISKRANPIFKITTVLHNKGYGYGILSGLEDALGDVLAWTHADMQTDPSDVLIAFEEFCKTDMTKTIMKGERTNRPAMDRFMTWGMQQVTRLYLKTGLDDINAQPKLFSKQFYSDVIKNKAPHDFSLDLYLLYQAKIAGITIKTIPVVFADRMHGEAKGGGGSWKNRIKLIKRTLNYIRYTAKKV
jgi:glycosyltransferase involved in cell wall biosynthesis